MKSIATQVKLHKPGLEQLVQFNRSLCGFIKRKMSHPRLYTSSYYLFSYCIHSEIVECLPFKNCTRIIWLSSSLKKGLHDNVIMTRTHKFVSVFY